MHPLLLRARARIRDATKPIGEALVGAATISVLRTTRYFDPIKTANFLGRLTRLIGPLTREQRIGRANLTAAFPEKSRQEIETILNGVWDNLGVSAPNLPISIISGNTIRRFPKKAGSKSGRARMSCSPNSGSTKSPR